MSAESTFAIESLESPRPERLPTPVSGEITPALDRSAVELFVRRPRRSILLVEDEFFSGRPLASILGRWNFEVATASSGDTAAQAIEGYGRMDLAVVALPGSPEADAALLETLRALPALEQTPILAVSRPDARAVDCDALRGLGVVGVMGCDRSPENAAFRVGQILPLGSMAERRHVRVPVDFAVEVETAVGRTGQRAENLSMGGIRLCSTVPLEINATVGLSFRLPLNPCETIAVEARVIHCAPAAGREGVYTVGLFFRSIPPRGRTLVEVEIVRLLAGPAAA
jgi:CheY-like chemotaxis protein